MRFSNYLELDCLFMSSEVYAAIRAVNVRSQFQVRIQNPDEKLHRHIPMLLLVKQELSFQILLLALYGVIFYFYFPFWRFASTMVALTSFLGESVPDDGKWGRFGKPRTTRFMFDHRNHVKRSLTRFVRPCSTTDCMAWLHNCSRVKQQTMQFYFKLERNNIQ